MKKAACIALLLIMAGCGSSLKHSWNNFTAYYNTFYNAKKYFKSGVSKVRKQPVHLNPDSIVRVHRTPPPAGKEDFNKAVDDAAEVLRRFPDSKWVGDALFLIGRSYYYLHKYFDAQQKFEAILALSEHTPLKQQAVIWEGRTLLDIPSYTQGVSFLKKQLAAFNGEWDPQNRAEVQVLLAEHYAELQKWSRAASLLETAVKAMHDKGLRGRSYFLLGQVLQKQGDFTKALQAYGRVKQHAPGYEYVYWAALKKADVARLADELTLSASIYASMLQDNRNYRRRGEIYYGQAQTYQQEGKYHQAEANYHTILNNPKVNTSNELRRRAYYQLGQLYGKQYNKYRLAAAYFDSASAQSAAGQMQAQGNRKVNELTAAYKQYASLKQDMGRIDSLLKLGSMSREALNHKLRMIRQHQQKRLLKSRNAVQEQHNLSNIGAEDIYTDSVTAGSGSQQYGFLNYKNSQRVQQARQQFKAVWGQRALADNWRRRVALSGTANRGGQPASDSVMHKKPPVQGQEPGVDLSAIPRTAKARKKLREQQWHDQYRLGSLFFLTINQPDSAAYYYHYILHRPISDSLKARTLYSLYQLYKLSGPPDSASIYKKQLLKRLPDSKFAGRIRRNEKGASGGTSTQQQDSSAALRKKAHQLMQQQGDSTRQETAERLRRLALKHRSSPAAPAVYYEGIRRYIQFAKAEDSVQTASDSLKAKLYSGKAWDRVREMLAEFKKTFPHAPQVSQVDIWLGMLLQ